MAVQPEHQELLHERRGPAVWARINRPDALNALTPAVVEGLDRALDAAEADAAVRAVVVTGAGRAFCAGADLRFVQDALGPPGGDGPGPFIERVGEVLDRLESFPKPTIAAVNGLALAGGLEVVLCCDLVVAAESARLGDAHANYGLIPGGGSSIRLPRKIGPTRAKYLLFTGEFVPAAELVEAGLVNRVVPDDELEAEVGRLVDTLAAKSPLALRRVKRLVDDGLDQPVATGLRLELATFESHLRSEDVREGLAAFAEKRAPRFSGR